MGRVSARNEYGSGSCYFDKRSDRWIVMAELSRRADGKRRRFKRVFRTSEQADQFLGSLQEHRTDQLHLDGATLTVAEMIASWQLTLGRRAADGELAPKTVAAYDFLAAHVLAGLGRHHANELEVEHIERFMQDQCIRLSADYVSRQLTLLDQAYRWAMTNRLLRWNPAALARAPKGRPPEGTALTVEQTQSLLAASQGHRLHALWCVMIGAALRPGEALALSWDALELDRSPAVLHVRAHLRTGTDGLYLGVPKTARSARSLDLPTFTAEALRDHRRAEHSVLSNQWDGLCFQTSSGTPFAHRNVRRDLAKLCKRADVPAVTPYDLRRTAASLLVDSGVHLESVADLLGHSSLSTTRAHYTKAVAPTVRHAGALDNVLADDVQR